MCIATITHSHIDEALLKERYGKYTVRIVQDSYRERFRIWFFEKDSDRIRFTEDFERFIVTSWPNHQPRT